MLYYGCGKDGMSGTVFQERILIQKVLSFLGDGRISREQNNIKALQFNGILGTSNKS
ncbi:hypothetical protein LMI01_15110 [Companilactobacillus mindensis]|jgi:hypothetical protein|nr:hypothetical protein LMI01_15110 [Companilactobacillus mindensis]